jgi:hypothetical protein
MKKFLIILTLLLGFQFSASAQTREVKVVVPAHPVIKPQPGAVVVTKKKVVKHRPHARRRAVRKTTVIVPAPPPPPVRVVVP